MTDSARPTYSIALLVDARGWILVQQRAADAAKQPNKWACIGGAIRPGENPEQAANRELADQAGVVVDAGLRHFSTEVFTWSTGTVAEYHTYAGPTSLTDADIDVRVGQRIVFVDPAELPGLDFTESGAHVLRSFIGSHAHRDATSGS